MMPMMLWALGLGYRPACGCMELMEKTTGRAALVPVLIGSDPRCGARVSARR